MGGVRESAAEKFIADCQSLLDAMETSKPDAEIAVYFVGMDQTKRENILHSMRRYTDAPNLSFPAPTITMRPESWKRLSVEITKG